MVYQLILGLAAVLLAGLIWAERGPGAARRLMFKTPLSLLFVVVALMMPHAETAYAYWILAGLVLGLIGDVCLALPQVAAFRAGLAAFLAGHLAYVIAFIPLAVPGAWISPGVLALLAVSLGSVRWLWPLAGKLRPAVMAYVLVITAMVWAALAVFNSALVMPPGSWVILLGAALFYLSDLCVARDRFDTPGWVNRLVGLPLYYGGQFLIAFSVGMVG